MTLTYSQQYYLDNKEKLSRQSKERYQKNKEAKKAASKAYYEANKEAYSERNKIWKLNNPEKYKKSQRGWEERNPSYYLVNNARRRAKEFGIPFSIKRSDIVVPDTCPVLGIPLFRGEGVLSDNSPSLDRIIPEKGYVPDNIRVISLKANRWKNEMTLDDALRIVAYLKGEV